MPKQLVALAARNNAEWCDAVCRAHGRGGGFDDALWLSPHDKPRFYPDAVTLAGEESEARIVDAVSKLIALRPHRGWAVKDSFCCIDLSGLGFAPLFDAHWIFRHPPGQDIPRPDVTARILREENEIAAWSDAWNGGSSGDIPFKPALRSEPGILFVQVEHSGAIIGGGILSKGAGVVGFSNVFSIGPDADAVWQSLIGCAGVSFPGWSLVGYERGEDLEAACRNGFQVIGPLRVWHRPE